MRRFPSHASRRTALILLLAVLAACGGDRTVMEPAPADALGTYEGSWTFTFTVVATGDTESVACPGSMAISSQSGNEFSGRYAVAAVEACQAVSGTIAGVISDDGVINFDLHVSSNGSSGLEYMTGCEYVRGRTVFQGILSGDQLSASATAVFDCPAANGMVVCNMVSVEISAGRA